eukprot:12433870-Prorocentrum_lima.AAC.1
MPVATGPDRVGGDTEYGVRSGGVADREGLALSLVGGAEVDLTTVSIAGDDAAMLVSVRAGEAP